MKHRSAMNERRERRAHRTRAKITGTAKIPRLAVYRSNASMYVQLIDDEKGATLASATSKEMRGTGDKTPKQELSTRVGERIAKKALELGIKKAVFDRRHYRYHGRVKAVAEGARKAGLTL